MLLSGGGWVCVERVFRVRVRFLLFPIWLVYSSPFDMKFRYRRIEKDILGVLSAA